MNAPFFVSVPLCCWLFVSFFIPKASASCRDDEVALLNQGLERYGDTLALRSPDDQKVFRGADEKLYSCYCKEGGRHSNGSCLASLPRSAPADIMNFTEGCTLPTCGGLDHMKCPRLQPDAYVVYTYATVCRDGLVRDEVSDRCVRPEECTPYEQSDEDRRECNNTAHMFYMEWPYQRQLTCDNPTLYASMFEKRPTKNCVCRHGRVRRDLNEHRPAACLLPHECAWGSPPTQNFYPKSGQNFSETLKQPAYVLREVPTLKPDTTTAGTRRIAAPGLKGIVVGRKPKKAAPESEMAAFLRGIVVAGARLNASSTPKTAASQQEIPAYVLREVPAPKPESAVPEPQRGAVSAPKAAARKPEIHGLESGIAAPEPQRRIAAPGLKSTAAPEPKIAAPKPKIAAPAPKEAALQPEKEVAAAVGPVPLSANKSAETVLVIKIEDKGSAATKPTLADIFGIAIMLAFVLN